MRVYEARFKGKPGDAETITSVYFPNRILAKAYLSKRLKATLAAWKKDFESIRHSTYRPYNSWRTISRHENSPCTVASIRRHDTNIRDHWHVTRTEVIWLLNDGMCDLGWDKRDDWKTTELESWTPLNKWVKAKQ